MLLKRGTDCYHFTRRLKTAQRKNQKTTTLAWLSLFLALDPGSKNWKTVKVTAMFFGK
uniref:Uncharacterized protein n=1 Tax=Anguilla anguilla TaxID=7936 RepID=A0A0E9TQX9_ANGAN